MPVSPPLPGERRRQRQGAAQALILDASQETLLAEDVDRAPGLAEQSLELRLRRLLRSSGPSAESAP